MGVRNGCASTNGELMAVQGALHEQIDDLGELVRDARDRARLSQRVVAERSGISLRTLREIENGRVRMPRRHSIQRLAEVLQEPRLLDQAAARSLLDEAAYGEDDRLMLRVLGPLSAVRGRSVLNAGTPMQQSLLGLMALHANESVSQAEIVDVLWGEAPPNSFNQLVHTYVSRLRALLAKHSDPSSDASAIVRRNAGYELQIGTDQLDLLRFRELAKEAEHARVSGDLTLEVRLLTDMLRLWSGPVLHGSSPRLQQHPLALDANQRQITAALRLAELAVAYGHYEKAIDQLQPLVRHHPLHEGLHAQLMVALAGAGRQVEALSLFSKLDRTLRIDFGIDPGPELRAAQLSVLRGVSRATDDKAVQTTTPRAEAKRPYGLPPDTPDLVGRSEHHQVLQHLTQSGSPGGLFGPSPVVSIYGPPGVGKSVLAVRVANSCRLRYADGVLYADLRSDTQADSHVAYTTLHRFLRALGMAEAEIPRGLDERISAYRSLLAERRVLVVVDNVVRDEELQPLLPGGFTSALLFTSRAPLSTIPGARHLPLSLFTAEQSVRLLTRIVGEERVLAERQMAEEIAELCGHLPLAIRIVGQRLLTRPHWSLSRMVHRLTDEQGRLSELSHGELDVRARLDTHFVSLASASRRALLALARACGGSFTLRAAAASLGCSLVAAEDTAETLVDHQLLEGPDSAGRYAFPVLTRLHARERFA
ncbi:BTAD domain-containing putative transcriptional regulator [Streptomyces atratus]|uniref:BTAD domain-containing putative transcriptional regulator n=1 Tax=Streptomyces atratus TaxID=1893 RepID=UPI0036C9841B